MLVKQKPLQTCSFITKPPASYMTSISSSNHAIKSSNLAISTVNTRKEDPVVITGISLGLPGGEKVFSEDTFERLVRGETCIKEVSKEYKQRLLDKNIVRLIKVGMALLIWSKPHSLMTFRNWQG